MPEVIVYMLDAIGFDVFYQEIAQGGDQVFFDKALIMAVGGWADGGY